MTVYASVPERKEADLDPDALPDEPIEACLGTGLGIHRTIELGRNLAHIKIYDARNDRPVLRWSGAS